MTSLIEWDYQGDGWFDRWHSRCGRVMIARHPRHDRGDYVIWIDGARVAQRDQIAFAKWKANNLLQELAE